MTAHEQNSLMWRNLRRKRLIDKHPWKPGEREALIRLHLKNRGVSPCPPGIADNVLMARDKWK